MLNRKEGEEGGTYNNTNGGKHNVVFGGNNNAENLLNFLGDSGLMSNQNENRILLLRIKMLFLVVMIIMGIC